MTLHMIYGGEPAADAPVSRTGGVPLVGAGFAWPKCKKCKGNMQFIVQLLPDDVSALDRSLLVFMCQNDPGMCDDWNPRSGGNKSFLYETGELVPAEVPQEGETTLPAVSRIRIAAEGQADTPVLGRVGGRPDWIQADETPGCRKCGDYMDFVAQLEQGHDFRTAINFGGDGLGYVFTCKPCQEASFVWQCS